MLYVFPAVPPAECAKRNDKEKSGKDWPDQAERKDFLMRVGLFTDTYLPDINGVVSSTVTLKKPLKKRDIPYL